MRSHRDLIRVKLPDSGSSGREPASMINDCGRDHKLRIYQHGIWRAPEDRQDKGLLRGVTRDVEVLCGVGKRRGRGTGSGRGRWELGMRTDFAFLGRGWRIEELVEFLRGAGRGVTADMSGWPGRNNNCRERTRLDSSRPGR